MKISCLCLGCHSVLSLLSTQCLPSLTLWAEALVQLSVDGDGDSDSACAAEALMMEILIVEDCEGNLNTLPATF